VPAVEVDVEAGDLHIDDGGWEPRTLSNGKRLLVKNGVFMRPSFNRRPPDLPAPLSHQDEVRAHIGDAVEQGQGVLIDFEVVDRDGFRVMRTVAKKRAEGRANAFLGALQIHFAPCWWLFQLEAIEAGTTGLREAAVFMMMRQEDENAWPLQDLGRIESMDALPPAGPPAKLPSDDPRWDDRFPDHPLSRVRRAQRDLIASMSISDRAAALPPFIGPPPGA